jgi:hypothetical protein
LTFHIYIAEQRKSETAKYIRKETIDMEKLKYKMEVLYVSDRKKKCTMETNSYEKLKQAVKEYYEDVHPYQSSIGEPTYIKTYEDNWQIYF